MWSYLSAGAATKSTNLADLHYLPRLSGSVNSTHFFLKKNNYVRQYNGS